MPQGPDPGGRRPDAPTAYEDILLTLLARGALAADDLASVRPAGSGVGEALATHLEREGIVETRVGGRLGLTPGGRARAEAVLARERRALAAEAGAIDPAFLRLNQRVKRAITAWQVRRVGDVEVPNDHRNPRHDTEVVAELCAAVEAAVALLTPLAELRARYAAYRDRLAEAAARVRAGERSFVSGLTVDSIHTVWWQLHGEILALQGRGRSPGDA